MLLKVIKSLVVSVAIVFVSAASAQAVTYNESTVTGESPTNTYLGCSDDAVTKRSVYLKDQWNSNVGYLELRYSVKCHAAWARLTNYYLHEAYNTHSGQAWIRRVNSTLNFTCYTPPGSFQSCYTKMIFDLDPLKAFAEADIDPYDVYYGVIEARTASY